MRGKLRMTATKRVIFLVAIVSTLVLATALRTRAEPEVPVTLRVVGPSAVVRVGQFFDVEIRAENAQNLGAFEFQYTFNPAIASTAAGNIRIGPFLGSTGRSTGELRLASAPMAPHLPLYGAYSYGAPAGPNGSGVVAVVTMQAVANGTSNLSLQDIQVTGISGQTIAATTVAGTVQVSGTPVQTRPMYLPVLLHSS